MKYFSYQGLAEVIFFQEDQARQANLDVQVIQINPNLYVLIFQHDRSDRMLITSIGITLPKGQVLAGPVMFTQPGLVVFSPEITADLPPEPPRRLDGA